MLNNHINYTVVYKKKNQKFASIWCNYHTSLQPYVYIQTLIKLTNSFLVNQIHIT